MKILILGASGMLGSAMFREMSADPIHTVCGTVRNSSGLRQFSSEATAHLITGVDVLDLDSLAAAIVATRPDVVINCVGLIKQVGSAKDPLVALPINALLPHRLARLCQISNARLIHISTDCVFSGRGEMYTETDISDAEDLYGKSKYIGELHDADNAITLRTSIIGHGLIPNESLIDWFLAQSGTVKGYEGAIFSGLPTVELARVIHQHVLPRPELFGLYHVSAQPIDKLNLLRLVAQVYGKRIEIVPDNQLRINRSLDSSRFRAATGYVPPSWPELIQLMHACR